MSLTAGYYVPFDVYDGCGHERDETDNDGMSNWSGDTGL
jgi:hypothetical protein